MSAPACGRLGCESTACCVLLIAAQECEAWLVGFDHDAADQGVNLCETHADRITVPFGWGLHNERPAPRKRRRRPSTAKAAPATEPDPLADGPATSSAEPVDAAPETSRTTRKRTAKKAAKSKAKPKSKPPADPVPELEREPIADDDTVAIDEPTIELPAAPTPPPAPADVPVAADHVADALAEADDPRHLQVVARDEAAAAVDATADDVQPSFWDDAEPDAQLDPSDRTPLLKRAFRVVRDD